MPSLRDATAESPAPVRAVANAVSQWIDKLGGVWVEGQIAQVNRRPGVNTVFMTLRDTVADISVTLTCSRSLFDSLNPPVVEGASVVVHARPSFYANRGTFSLYAREIKMVGLGELLARLERRRQLLAAEGLFAPELKRDLPFLPHRIGLVTAPNSAAERDVLENAKRRWPSVQFEVVYAAMQGTRCAEEVMEALRELGAEMGGSWTRNVPLYGGMLPRSELMARAAEGTTKVPLATRRRWALTYGDRIESLYAQIEAEPALAAEVAPGVPRAELGYAAEVEDATTAEDFLLRRTKLHLMLDAAGRAAIGQWFVTRV